MPPPFWIHCNRCMSIYDGKSKFYMLNCCHLLCKNCMHQTNGGTKCPLCKKDIKFEEISKLPDKIKAFFGHNITHMLSKPLKMLKFQRSQQANLFKLSSEYKSKCKKACEMIAKQEQQIQNLKAEYDKLVAHRRLMQNKLKQIYLNKQKRVGGYRSPVNAIPSSMSTSSKSALSSTPSSRNRPNFNSTTRSGTSNGSTFFNRDAPMLKSSNSRITPQQQHKVPSSQSSRKPFLA